MRKLVIVNPSDRTYLRRTFESGRWIIWLGQHAPTYLMIWAECLSDALDIAIDWAVDNAPGYLCDDEVAEEYNRLIAEARAAGEDTDDDEVTQRCQEEAEVDTTSGGNCGNHVRSDDWGYVYGPETERVWIKAWLADTDTEITLA